MKLTIERAALLKALSHVQSVVERRTTIPILSNVLLSAGRNGLTLSATDLDIEIIEEANAEVEREGAVTAPAHTLYEIVRKIPDGADITLELSADEPRLTLNSGRSRFALPVLPAGDFPTLSSDGLNHTFTLEKDQLVRLIDRTRFAVSTEETRYYLNGVYLHALEEDGNSVLRAVATDGHRLALADLPCPEGAAGMSGVIVPRKTAAEVRRLLDDAADTITVAVSNAKIRFELGRATLTSKVIDGTFPDYGRVIPKGNDRMMKVDNRLFAAAVDRVATISLEKSRSVKLALDEDRLTLSVRNPEAGQAVEEIAVDFQAEGFEIGFNAKYLLDITGEIQADEATFAFADAAAPALVTDEKDAGVRYVLMPLRV